MIDARTGRQARLSALSRARTVVVGVVAMMLVSCDGSGGAPGSSGSAPTPTPTPAPAPTPTPTASPVGLFVNPAPDTASDKASAYVGWTATAGATGYVVRYAVDGGATAQVALGAVTGTQLTNLPAGGQLSVTIAAISGTGTSPDSIAVVTPLPRAPTAAETAAYTNAAAYSDGNLGEAVVVMRYGRVVYTHYAAGYANTGHPLASGSKSFTCALEGFAEQDGVLKLTDKAADTITDWQSDANKSKITLLDLLSLQSGLTGSGLFAGQRLNARHLSAGGRRNRQLSARSGVRLRPALVPEFRADFSGAQRGQLWR